MDIVNLIIQLVSGAVGGNVAGAAMPDKSLGAVGNSVTGLIGGALGGYVAQALNIIGSAAGSAAAGQAATGFDVTSLLANVGTSGVSGAVLMIIVGLIKSYMVNKS